MTATYARRCGACRQIHLCRDVIRLCVCSLCESAEAIDTVAARPDPGATDWISRLWKAARDAR